MIWDFVKQAFEGILAPVTTVINGWQERKKAALEADLRITEARTAAQIKIMETQQTADIAWENLSITNSGWKDEWFTILLSIPAVLCFIPGLDLYVYAGFKALDGCPEWYRWCFMLAVGASFGYRKIADFMSLKKGA
jgi:hypothetical protein